MTTTREIKEVVWLFEIPGRRMSLANEQVKENVHGRDEIQKIFAWPERDDCLWSNKIAGMAKSQTKVGPRGIVCGREESKNMLLLSMLSC
jgi:hypothetical protein